MGRERWEGEFRTFRASAEKEIEALRESLRAAHTGLSTTVSNAQAIATVAEANARRAEQSAEAAKDAANAKEHEVQDALVLLQGLRDDSTAVAQTVASALLREPLRTEFLRGASTAIGTLTSESTRISNTLAEQAARLDELSSRVGPGWERVTQKIADEGFSTEFIYFVTTGDFNLLMDSVRESGVEGQRNPTSHCTVVATNVKQLLDGPHRLECVLYRKHLAPIFAR